MLIRIGDRIVEAEMKNGVPVIKAQAEEIKRPDGGTDVVVHVPCMKIKTKKGS